MQNIFLDKAESLKPILHERTVLPIHFGDVEPEAGSVFEDGPKRDRRLWIGDLRQQALVNYETFDQLDLVKRCLYMFAGYTEEGKHTPRCIYINSKGTACDGDVFVDYSLMFNWILCDYYEHTGDTDLVEELFELADKQILLACRALDEDGIVQVIPVDGRWAFIDWCKDLQKITSMQGVILYTLGRMIWLCRQTGRKILTRKYLFRDILRFLHTMTAS